MSLNLKPWYAVAIPHEDIREGRLSEAVFAANLWAVKQGNAPEVYLAPEAFVAKTYLTAGLTNVLKKVSRALSGQVDAGDRILSLQTAFGGGKTHSLVALWHLAHGYAPLAQAAGANLGTKVNVAVFTNRTCDATQGRQTPEGIHTRTLWGELALQLGGVDLYRKIEANDQSRSVTQGLFPEILAQAAPCLILLDEVADYCVGASAVEAGDSTLADQTVSFIQELTDAVEQVKGAVIVATLPASHLEIASSEKGQEILQRLEKRFGRMGADIKPVADNEIYEVVRRRLFETVGDVAEHERVASAYVKMYQQHKNEVPVEATRGTYKDQIVAAYPFHPTLIDALYLRWGSHSDFQRTRGVLRLLASVVGDLWQRRNNETQSQPLIQPCHVRWTIDAMHSVLTRLWGAAYESVVAADVLSDKSNALLLDQERSGDYLAEKIAQGLASAILLGSFGGQGERAGYSTKDLKLAVGRPDLNWGYTDGALLALEERAFYLHTASAGNLGKRYWFGTKPTLTKLIVQYRNQFASQDFDAEIIRTLEDQVSGLRTEPATWRVLVNPSADLPEQKALTLLIMPPACAYSENGTSVVRLAPSYTEQRLLELSQKCGTQDRHYRNTLLFLLPSPRGLNRLRNALCEVAALEAVKRDYSSQLDVDQVDDLDGRLKTARKTVGEALGSAYTHIARIENQKLAVVALTSIGPTWSEHLQSVWRQLVDDEEWVLRKVGTVTLQKVGLILTEGSMRVKDAIEAFLRYTDKPMIASRDAVMQGITQACKDRLIGIGRGLNPKDLQKKWCGESVTLDSNEEGLWILPPFEIKAEQAEAGQVDAGVAQPAKPGVVAVSPTEVQPLATATTKAGKQVRRITIKGNVALDSWSDVFRCFVSPAARMGMKQLRLGIDFEMVTHEGQPLDENDPTLKVMKEAARQLGLKLEEE